MGFYDWYTNNEVRIAIGNFLSKELINTKYVFISIWSFVHLISGGIIMYLLKRGKLNLATRYLVLFVLLFLFEVIEFPFHSGLPNLFIPETKVDILWDLIIGMLGGVLVDIFYKSSKN